MAKYRKKPVVIEAVQVNNNDFALAEFITVEGVYFGTDMNSNTYLEIETLEGTMRADHEDWIIRGVKGEFYPCKPDIFEATYEAVTERS